MTIEDKLRKFQKELGGRYEVKGIIHGNLQNTIVLAEDTELKRPCVIKKSKNQDKVAMLKKSAETLAQITNKTNVVEVYDFIKDKYLVMEFVDGGSLLDGISFGKLDLKEALGISKQMCEGLIAVHNAGVVHCDVTPGNVLITKNGVVKLADLGLARKTEAGTLETYGTVGYFAPEQCASSSEGGEAEIDYRADIYSFGVILYEMLAGEHPFKDAKRNEAKYRQMQLDEGLIARLDIKGVPEHVMGIIKKCMQPDKTKRYGNTDDGENAAQELSDALPYGALDKLYDMCRRAADSLGDVHTKYGALEPKAVLKTRQRMAEINNYISDNNLQKNEEAVKAFGEVLIKVAERRNLDYAKIFDFVYKGCSSKGPSSDPPINDFVRQMAEEPEKRELFGILTSAGYWDFTHKSPDPNDKEALQRHNKVFLDKILK